MDKSMVRMQSAVLINFKNITHGEIRFPCSLKADIFGGQADILGLYGQNGSGKTAFIRALTVLDAMLSGTPLPGDSGYYITAGADACRLSFSFSIKVSGCNYKAKYEIQLLHSGNAAEVYPVLPPVVVAAERLTLAAVRNSKWVNTAIIDYNAFRDDLFLPRARVAELFGRERSGRDHLRLAKRAAAREGRSFIFSPELGQLHAQASDDGNINRQIILALTEFGRRHFYIIDGSRTGMINTNRLLPFGHDSGFNDGGRLSIRLDGPSTIPEASLGPVKNTVDMTNQVLGRLIPGLSVKIAELGRRLLKNNASGLIIELISARDGMEIPLRFESEGIVKIISILHMLILVHHDPSMTLAVDELDSGIFEYLLGEILKILQQTGRGQLIFTSHNLRPLETLEKESILFTTSNPEQRYIRMQNVTGRHNLRDFYYHDLILGGQKERIYTPTNSFAINRAFRLAGESYES